MKIMHIITSLETGGAETTMCRLVQAMSGHTHVVVSLTSIGAPGESLIEAGHEVHALRIRMSNLIGALIRLWRLMRHHRPDVIQTWMYHSDLLGGLMGRLAGCRHVFWNIRNTEIPHSIWSRTGWIVRASAALSRIIPRAIVCCAHAAKLKHVALGYPDDRMVVIQNGYDVNSWRLPTQTRSEVRSSLGFPATAFIVGMVGRMDPLKGHDIFIEAAGAMAARFHGELLFVMVGRGVEESNTSLQKIIKEKGGQAQFRQLGERRDISQLMYALDLYCLSSYSEGFPNVVAEAMLMQTPCVVTDVGDAGRIVGDIGRVVPPNEPVALADALLSLASMEEKNRQALGLAARERISAQFDIQFIAQQYVNLYTKQIHHA